MKEIVKDKNFWFYFLVILFIVFINISQIVNHNRINLIIIFLLIISYICLFIIVYLSIPENFSWSNFLAGRKSEFKINKNWWIINFIFFLNLIITSVWLSKINNPSSNYFDFYICFIIMSTFILLYLSYNSSMIIRCNHYKINIFVALSIFYFLVWFLISIIIQNIN